MKNIFKIHFLYYLVALICFLTGHFKEFIIFSSIIIVHELGHILTSFIFKWKIDKVILLPFGGITIFKELIDKPLKEEFLIAIMGPIFQLIFFFLYKDNAIFSYYNIVILLFNLLPIYPLDGSKIINILCNNILSFKYSHILTSILSVITLSFILVLGIYKFQLLIMLILLFLIIEVVKEIYKHDYYFNRFLLERYLYNFNFKRQKTIKNIQQMKKQTKHTFFYNNKYYTEREIMRKRFDK